MIFNKKKSFLYISILLLILVGVYFTVSVNGVGFIIRTPSLSTGFVTTNATAGITHNQNQTSNGNGLTFGYTELANWTRGGTIEFFNFTLVLNADAFNITEINITLPGYVSGFSNITNSGMGNISDQVPNTGSNWTFARLYETSSSRIATFLVTNVTAPPYNGSLFPYENVSMWFNVITANGTEAVYNWTTTVTNGSTSDAGFGVVTGVDGLPPRAGTTNVTDSVNTRNSFASTQYLRYDTTNPQQGINISLTTTDYNIDRVLLIYNSTGGSLNLTAIRHQIYNNVSEIKAGVGSDSNDGTGPGFNGEILERAGLFGNGNATGSLSLHTRSDVSRTSAPGYVFSFNISNNTWGQGASDATTFRYVFVVYDLYNHSEIINNSNADYVIARDTQNPTATLTAPSDTSISLYGTVKYTCSGSDTSSIASCTMTITKPGSSGTITKTGCSEQTIGSPTTETNTAGDYTVACSVTDGVGRTASSSSATFTVSAASTGGGSGDGGGGGGGSAGSSADNPVTVSEGVTTELGALSTSDTYTSIPASGGISFSISGQSHTAKVLTVTTTSATIEFASTPSQVTLNVGETKEVDLNDNGKMDLSVMLKSITNGKADLVFKMITEVTETPTTTEPTVEPPTTEKSSSTWVWILVIIVVVVLLIWYFSKKNR